MFQKILIANRGEIASRVIATCRRLGIATVAVFSDADAGAKHVRLADEAVRIGPAPVAESYLRADAIVDAALRTGAQAIHPGYGFLSESASFVEAVEAAGLVFIGPPASAIRAMGLKDAAKAAMEKAGVPVVPGYHGGAQDLGTLSAAADRIGYPVLIKARAGGGGKGMRLVESAADFAEALAGAQREAQSSFGDPAVLVEKYVSSPRHVEMQIFADSHGGVVHLFERDCSLQRRHQKVIEEAPAPGMTEAVREAMGRAAVEAARAIGYRGAGTIEFIADGSRGLRADAFWFMEMNTRLQVEHPVSEAITGLDFVELQLRIAAGEPLGFRQDALRIEGHAFEARLYAEDVAKGFLPATGTLAHLSFPRHVAFTGGAVRIDSGVGEGDTISPWYDPMIAKIIVHGADRQSALQRLAATLEATRVAGTVTNLAFLASLARHPGFAAGEVDTGLIGRDLAQLSAQAQPSAQTAIVAALALDGLIPQAAGDGPTARLRGFRLWGKTRVHAKLQRADETVALTFDIAGDEVTTSEGETLRLAQEGETVVLTSGTASRGLTVVLRNGAATVFDGAGSATYRKVDPLDRTAHSEAGDSAIVSPMPGRVTHLAAEPGQQVQAGQALVVIEAMKMEHTLRAARDGVVAAVAIEIGRQVDDGDVLILLEDLEAD